MSDFDIVDLISQREAVRQHTRGWSSGEVVAWLATRGRLDRASLEGWGYFVFESRVGLFAVFYIFRGYIVFMPPVEPLSSEDHELSCIQAFMTAHELCGLSQYFCNRWPDLTHIHEAVAAMRRHGVVELAALLSEAVELFADYVPCDPSTSWEEVCRHHDPTGLLDRLDERIRALDNYGISPDALRP
jgi:hypothetical protein